MRWPIALLVGYVLLALEPPVREALRVGATGAVGEGFSPSLVAPFVVFVALLGAREAALWVGLLIGLAVDLSTLRGTGALVVVGPHALGYLGAATMVQALRPIVVRKSVITLVVLSMLGELAASVIASVVFSLRRMLLHGTWADGIPGSLLGELGQNVVGSLYTGLTALAVAAVLFPMLPWFGFPEPGARRPFMK